jgi:hypothetical protein
MEESPGCAGATTGAWRLDEVPSHQLSSSQCVGNVTWVIVGLSSESRIRFVWDISLKETFYHLCHRAIYSNGI